MNNEAMVTVEFYEDVAHEKLIGAVYLETKRLTENVELVGRRSAWPGG